MWPHSFHGDPRRRPQVNLSGRNPFSATTRPKTSQDAVAHAQQGRLARQQERLRLQAAKTLQRTWRGYASRKETKSTLRQDWDYRDTVATSEHATCKPTYRSSSEALAQLRLLVQLASPADPLDVERLQRFAAKSCKIDHKAVWNTDVALSYEWIYPLLSAAKICLAMIQRSCMGSLLPTGALNDFLLFLSEVFRSIPNQMVLYSRTYFETLALLLRSAAPNLPPQGSSEILFEQALLTPLRSDIVNIAAAYESFADQLLTTGDLQEHFPIERLTGVLKPRLLMTAIQSLFMSHPNSKVLNRRSDNEVLWLSAYTIYLQRMAKLTGTLTVTPDLEFIQVVPMMLSRLSEDTVFRIGSAERSSDGSLPAFVVHQISSLADQESITGLLRNSNLVMITTESMQSVPNGTAALANYALTLLRVFPRRGDEIRMWLYLGSTTNQTVPIDQVDTQLPAIKYFWKAVMRTDVFYLGSQNAFKAIAVLKTDIFGRLPAQTIQGQISNIWEREWRIILLFLELYTFVLKVMDDEEFVNGADRSLEHQSWTRRSALKLTEVKDLTVFLKNLAFTIYWYAPEIAGSDAPITEHHIAEYFGNTSMASSTHKIVEATSAPNEVAITAVDGMSISYMRGMVTGLLRMIYERDSRRKFLPEGHWLMTNYFDMKGFIPAVVQEEDYKRQHQEEDEEEDDLIQPNSDEDSDGDTLIGTGRTQRVRRLERLKRQQRKTARRKQLSAVTPRLEILQNMPFFIPFTTRVEIFHEFVSQDQTKRRGGYIDADQWRMSLMHDPRNDRRAIHDELSKHSARIRRDHCFEDAYDQFYDLGEGFKEPIQISFVDQFGTEEAGIDGGGVTKEFLTSVTSEAFTPSTGLKLFVENDQHLLYPNPATVDERKDLLRQIGGYQEGSSEWNEQVRDLLRRYEFLGRVVGKCLYEGILIDIHFAPFFLVKWALTGGSSSAANESSYRASINDLRDLDEALYQGLLQLKNYSGNVEDFSLDFTITDVISTPEYDSEPKSQLKHKTITRELRKNGAQIPVTNENRLVYISYVARHRLQIQPHLQTSAFLRGLGAMIQPSWLSMFNQSELQTLIGGGSSEIDVSDLRRNTLYGGVYMIGDDNEEHPTVKMFWRVMQSFSDAERRKVLKYVTSTPRAPILGFKQLNPPFSIRDSGSDQTRLPSTSTCVNLLKLPIYSDEALLRRKLQYAINAGAGFNLS